MAKKAQSVVGWAAEEELLGKVVVDFEQAAAAAERLERQIEENRQRTGAARLEAAAKSYLETGDFGGEVAAPSTLDAELAAAQRRVEVLRLAKASAEERMAEAKRAASFAQWEAERPAWEARQKRIRETVGVLAELLDQEVAARKERAASGYLVSSTSWPVFGTDTAQSVTSILGFSLLHKAMAAYRRAAAQTSGPRTMSEEAMRRAVGL